MGITAFFYASPASIEDVERAVRRGELVALDPAELARQSGRLRTVYHAMIADHGGSYAFALARWLQNDPAFVRGEPLAEERARDLDDDESRRCGSARAFRPSTTAAVRFACCSSTRRTLRGGSASAAGCDGACGSSLLVRRRRHAAVRRRGHPVILGDHVVDRIEGRVEAAVETLERRVGRTVLRRGVVRRVG